MRCYQITVSGELQGEGLRFSAMHLAYQHHLKGFVRYNNPSEIFIEAEGEENPLQQFIEWFQNGSLSSRVSVVSIKESDVKGYEAFEIRHTVNEKLEASPETQERISLKAFIKKYLPG